MALFLFNLIFFALGFVANLVSRLIFSTIAHLLVLLIHECKLPGQAIQGGLQQVSEGLKSCLEYFLSLIMKAIGAIISTLFECLMGSFTGSATVVTSSVWDVLEKTRTPLDALKSLQEAASFDIVINLWNNYKDALGYVVENV